jgi:hypothetical protein
VRDPEMMRIRALVARFLGKMPKTDLQVLESKEVIFWNGGFLGKMPKTLLAGLS